MPSNQEPLDRNALKLQALLERVSSLTAQYENQAADLRVELTVVSTDLQRLQQATAENAAAQVQDVVVQGEVVEETPKKTTRTSK